MRLANRLATTLLAITLAEALKTTCIHHIAGILAAAACGL
jgi:hypothetical protein